MIKTLPSHTVIIYMTLKMISSSQRNPWEWDLFSLNHPNFVLLFSVGGKKWNQEEKKLRRLSVLRRSFFNDGCVFPIPILLDRNKSIIVIQIHFIYPQECYPHSNLLPSEVVV